MGESGRGQRVGTAAVAAGLCLLGLAACGGSSDSGATTASGAAAGGSANVADARAVAALASKNLLFGPTTGSAAQSQLRAPTAADVKAFPYKPGGPSRKVVWVSCAPVSGQCTHTAEIGKAYLAKLGIGGSVVQSDYTPAGNQRALDTALASKPDAIVIVAIAPSTIGPEIARAKAAHIPIVDGIGTRETDKGDLDAYVPQGSNLYQIAAAAQTIAASGGKGSIHWLNAPEFPQLEVAPGTQYVKTACPACKLTEGTETAAQVTDPVKMGQFVTSNIRANPSLNYLVLASACADLQSAAAAARQSGSVKIAAGGCGASAVSAMNAGNIPFATGSVEPWSALASIDQVLRLWAGQPPLDERQTGPAAYLVTPETTPDKSTKASYGKLDRWTVSKFDYVKPYSQAWGVDLSDVIANEK
jgi:ABC-type sugar transport system substrate-binding protein